MGALAMAYVGPADFLFVGMFFAAVHRFKMRTHETFRAVGGALIAYLLIVLLLGHISIGAVSLGMLPALVPIGVAVLWTNWREFTLTKDELQSTIGVAVVMLALLIWASTRPKPRPEPLQTAASQAAPGPQATPAPAP